MKKFLVSAIVGLIGSALIVLLDIIFVRWIFTLVPNSDYARLIKIVIIFVDFWLTAGFCVLPFVLGAGIGIALNQE